MDVLKLFILIALFGSILHMYFIIQDLTDKMMTLENKYLESLVFMENERAALLLKAEELNKSQATIDPSILIANNDMIKFYLQAAGVVGLSIVGLVVWNQVVPLTFALSWKAVIPTKVFLLLQNYTPFFQTRETYVDSDPISNVDWLVHIINSKSIDLWVKPEGYLDFIKASEYLENLSLAACVTANPELATVVSLAGSCELLSSVPDRAELATKAALSTIDPGVAEALKRFESLA
jgi:hypothetical protein